MRRRAGSPWFNPGVSESPLPTGPRGEHRGCVELVSIAAAPVLAYLILAGLVALDAAFPTIPSDVAVVSAGALAAAGQLQIGWAAAAVVIGAMGGDHLVYIIGRRPLPGVLDRSRLGRRLHDAADRALGSMTGASTAALVIGRFIPFGRTASAAGAGLAGVPPRRYAWISLLGASAWTAWVLGLGYVTGQASGGPMWRQIAVATAVGVGAAALIAVVHRMILRRRAASVTAGQPEVAARARRRDGTPCESVRQTPG